MAWAQTRARLRESYALFETLRSLGMSEDGARRAADLDTRLADALDAREHLQFGLREIQGNVELVRAINLYAAAEGYFPDRPLPDEAAND